MGIKRAGGEGNGVTKRERRRRRRRRRFFPCAPSCFKILK
jgi:hypothetical protein